MIMELEEVELVAYSTFRAHIAGIDFDVLTMFVIEQPLFVRFIVAD